MITIYHYRIKDSGKTNRVLSIMFRSVKISALKSSKKRRDYFNFGINFLMNTLLSCDDTATLRFIVIGKLSCLNHFLSFR